MKYYRYEAKKNGEFVGIFTVLNPYQRRYFNRFLKAPKWYETHPDVDSRCWFTEFGYQKYQKIMNELISQIPHIETRLIVESDLPNLAVVGKVQCIQLV